MDPKHKPLLKLLPALDEMLLKLLTEKLNYYQIDFNVLGKEKNGDPAISGLYLAMMTPTVAAIMTKLAKIFESPEKTQRFYDFLDENA